MSRLSEKTAKVEKILDMLNRRVNKATRALIDAQNDWKSSKPSERDFVYGRVKVLQAKFDEVVTIRNIIMEGNFK